MVGIVAFMVELVCLTHLNRVEITSEPIPTGGVVLIISTRGVSSFSSFATSY